MAHFEPCILRLNEALHDMFHDVFAHWCLEWANER